MSQISIDPIAPEGHVIVGPLLGRSSEFIMWALYREHSRLGEVTYYWPDEPTPWLAYRWDDHEKSPKFATSEEATSWLIEATS